MAFTAKFTGKHGQVEISQIAITAGAAEAQSDTVSINMDITDMSKGEALMLIDKIRDRIHAADFPPA